MILTEENHKVSSNGLTETGDFSIKTNPAAFQLLSSGLYSNKIKAVIRELSCNAVDAHAMVGKTDLPIEVKLPNAIDTQFYVKDFGPGLSHAQVMQLYTTYFDSTKRDSNDFIGGFGLGSKSPFAYTDSFSVETRQGGKIRTYTAFVEDGFPKIAFMAEQDTAEPDGLTVSFAVKPSDFPRFTSEASDVFQWFNQKPHLLGTAEQIPEITKLSLSKNISVLSTKNGRVTYEPLVRMGNVSYPLTKFFSQLDDDDADKDLFMWVRTRSLLLEAPIGSISVAASREELAYDKPSIASLRELLKEGYACSMREVIDTLLQLDTSKWSDRKQGQELLRAAGLNSLLSSAELQKPNFHSSARVIPFLNKVLEERQILPEVFAPFFQASPLIDKSSYKTLNLFCGNSTTRGAASWDVITDSASAHQDRRMPVPPREVAIFVDDIPEKSTWAQKAWKAWKPTHMTVPRRYYYVIKPLPEQEGTPEFALEKQRLLAELGYPQELPALSTALPQKDLEAMQGRTGRSFLGTTYFAKKLTRVYEGKTFYYLPRAKYTPVESGDPVEQERASELRSLLNILTPSGSEKATDNAVRDFLKMAGVSSARMYIIEPEDEAAVKTMTGAKSILDTCLRAFTTGSVLPALEKMDTVIDIGNKDSRQNPLSSILFASTYGVGRDLSKAIEGTKLGSLVEKIRKYHHADDAAPHKIIFALAAAVNKYAGSPITIPAKIISFNARHMINSEYPMFKNMTSSLDTADIEHLTSYLKWCESQKKADNLVDSTSMLLG